MVPWINLFVKENNLCATVKLILPYISYQIIVIQVLNLSPVSQVGENINAAYIKEVEWTTNQMLCPYKKMCSYRKVFCLSYFLSKIIPRSKSVISIIFNLGTSRRCCD